MSPVVKQTMRMNRETWIKIASWALIILVAPFALEIAFVAEVVGVDVAVGMLLLYFSAFTAAVRSRIDALNALVASALQSRASKLQYVTRSYFWNTALSCVVVWISGSLLLAIALWMPTFVVASQHL